MLAIKWRALTKDRFARVRWKFLPSVRKGEKSQNGGHSEAQAKTYRDLCGHIIAYALDLHTWPRNHGVAKTEKDMKALLRVLLV